jgi:hypothetical protein
VDHKVSDKDVLLLGRLSQTKDWCTRPGRGNDAALSLRTPSLMPSLIVKDGDYQPSWNYDLAHPEVEVERLCIRRLALVEVSDRASNMSSSMTGRVLLFYPRETLCDGSADVNSKGYFDDWNIPPWDTWFYFDRLEDGKEVLYCWVPDDFLHLAEAGVSANPEQCLAWFGAQSGDKLNVYCIS